jgi:hypothetical protein
VNSFAMTAAIVYCGANSDSDTWGLFPMTMVTSHRLAPGRAKPEHDGAHDARSARRTSRREWASKRVAPSA